MRIEVTVEEGTVGEIAVTKIDALKDGSQSPEMNVVPKLGKMER